MLPGEPPPSTAAAVPRAPRPSRGTPRAGRDGAKLTWRESRPQHPASPAPARSVSAAPPVPPFNGARLGAAPAAGAPRPVRPAGATPRGGGEPGALLPSAAGSTPGSVSPRGPCCPGDIGGQRDQPRGCFSCGYHPAALLRMPGAVLGVFQLWVPPALTKTSGSQPRLRHPICAG